MLLRNHTDDRLDIPALGLSVGPGESFEATGDVAKSLLDQGFQRVDTPARQRAAAARRKDNDDTAPAGTEES